MLEYRRLLSLISSIKLGMQTYFHSNVTKFYVPPHLVNWETDFEDYNPPYYVAPRVIRAPSWADPELTEGIKFNQIDGNINRKSYTGMYKVVNGLPLNPRGRTGIAGRGLLGKWGPNHAVDIAICRRSTNGSIECINIIRKDNGKSSYPGGMIDDGETSEEATIREAMEEVFNISDSVNRQKAHEWLKRNVPKSIIVYEGYVGDFRSTDNAWIETCVRACLEDPNDPIDFPVSAGDDAADAFWKTSSQMQSIFGSSDK